MSSTNEARAADPSAPLIGVLGAGQLGRMLALAPQLMREHGVTGGFRVLVNNGPDGRQEVPHLHLHAMGGPRPWAKG